MFNLIEELFSPGRRHTEDERRRLEHTRVEEGSNDPGHGPVDLTSGQVLIRPPEQRGPVPYEDGRTTGSTAGRASGDNGGTGGTDQDGDRSR
ncbi:DUF6191 domain-containing protein [Streptomyces marispadix]|uniref:DUF6191 domain-containing protein n=1 Tax=Streptomyces marispadix TaxID=2922868 RepID=A0ABS9T2M9_9ACTN|nr:DUF6191 domain-containing protein [Streptomyces marispadix]MCH6162781.1 DUF6191 domain-containing protein [Streptomyces marispadix]